MNYFEWLKERKKGIGGSDVGAIYNLGFGCSRALYYDKKGIRPDFEKTETAEFERGHLMEPVIIELYRRKTLRKTIHLQDAAPLIDNQHPWMRVNMDAVATDPQLGDMYVEAKCVNRFIMAKFKREGVRESYILQMNHGLHVAKLQHGSFAILCLDPWEFQYFDIIKDNGLVNQIIEGEKAWWQAMIDGSIPDQLLDPNDNRCASCQWRVTCRGENFLLAPETNKTDEREIESRPDLTPLVAQWVELAELIKAAETELEPIKTQIKEAIGTKYGIIVPGVRVIKPVWFEQRTDSAEIKKLMPRINTAIDFINELGLDPTWEQVIPMISECLHIFQTLVNCKKPRTEKTSLRYFPSCDE